MADKICIHHPGVTGNFRCYQCKSPICRDCRRHWHHHYFCGYSCFIRYLLREFQGAARRHQLRAIFALQILLVGIMIYMMLYYHHRLDSLAESLPAKTDSSAYPALQSFLKDHFIDFKNLPLSPPKEKSEYFHRVSLSVKRNWVITIWRNQQPVITEWVRKEGTIPYLIPLDYGDNLIRILVLDAHQQVVEQQQLSVSYQNTLVELFRHSVERGNIDHKNLALTFDAGSDDSFSREILSILKIHELHCTMFLTGEFMIRYPDLVREMLENGHEIANHTFSHPHLTTYAENRQHHLQAGVSREFVQDQLLRTDSIFYHLTGQRLKPFWRAPFGEYNPQILTWAAEIGYLHIRWTGGFDTHDWVTDVTSDLYHTPEEIFQNLMSAEPRYPHGLNGVIMLMHLGSQREENHIFQILPRLIPAIREKGYALGRISEIIN